MPDAILCTKGLRAGYAGRIVVGGLELEINAGEIVTLIGPNGSGKSTILRSVSGNLVPVGGVIYIDGRMIGEYSGKELARELSILFTGKKIPELMTCREVCETGRYPYTGILGKLSAADRDIVADAMEAMHVGALSESDFDRISDGQRQLVMLARAICQQPKLLILDEPTSYLDISRKLEFLGLMRELVRKKKIAVLMSLHEVDLAQKVSDRIVCIKDGRAVLSGTPEEVLTGEAVSGLYGMNSGSYQQSYGSAELDAVKGKPMVFVIGGGGAAIPVYRRLQRAGIPFAAGIIAENDIEYPAAGALSSVLIAVRAFEPVGMTEVSQALEVMDGCERVICCVSEYGTMNRMCRLLYERAKETGKLEET